MKMIHKQLLTRDYHQDLKMPIGSKILSLQVQGEFAVIWYEFFENHLKETQTRQFFVARTGDSYNFYLPMQFIGTFQLPNGFVGHVFEVARG